MRGSDTGQNEQERQLEVELRAAMPSPTPDETVARVPVRAPGRTQGASFLNPDISVNADFTFLGTDNNQLDKANAFSLREAEVGLQAPIDPFARAESVGPVPAVDRRGGQRPHQPVVGRPGECCSAVRTRPEHA